LLPLGNLAHTRCQLGAKNERTAKRGGLRLFARGPLPERGKRVQDAIELPNCDNRITDRRAEPRLLNGEIQRDIAREGDPSDAIERIEYCPNETGVLCGRGALSDIESGNRRQPFERARTETRECEAHWSDEKLALYDVKPRRLAVALHQSVHLASHRDERVIADTGRGSNEQATGDARQRRRDS
jgi:hypothetical protein